MKTKEIRIKLVPSWSEIAGVRTGGYKIVALTNAINVEADGQKYGINSFVTEKTAERLNQSKVYQITISN